VAASLPDRFRADAGPRPILGRRGRSGSRVAWPRFFGRSPPARCFVIGNGEPQNSSPREGLSSPHRATVPSPKELPLGEWVVPGSWEQPSPGPLKEPPSFPAISGQKNSRDRAWAPKRLRHPRSRERWRWEPASPQHLKLTVILGALSRRHLTRRSATLIHSHLHAGIVTNGESPISSPGSRAEVGAVSAPPGRPHHALPTNAQPGLGNE